MSFESLNIEPDTFGYRPSEEQQEKMEVLKSLLSILQKKEVKFAIAGGYGLDALYGSITRDHNDYDFVVFDENISDFESVVADAGFTRVSTKESGTVVFTHPKRNIKLEYMPASKVQAFLDEVEDGNESTLTVNQITRQVLVRVWKYQHLMLSCSRSLMHCRIAVLIHLIRMQVINYRSTKRLKTTSSFNPNLPRPLGRHRSSDCYSAYSCFEI